MVTSARHAAMAKIANFIISQHTPSGGRSLTERMQTPGYVAKKLHRVENRYQSIPKSRGSPMMLLKPNIRDLVNKKDIGTLTAATGHWHAGIRAKAAAA